MSPGFFDNPKLGLPSLNGLMILFSAKTGLVEALLLDNGYLTDVRTAAAGAVAASHLAPETVETAVCLARVCKPACKFRPPIWSAPSSACCMGKRPGEGRGLRRDLITLGITAESATAERAVRESQLVITTTPSREPVLRADWLHPRLHITAMGSDQAGKNEIEPQAVARADLYVCDRLSQAEKLGELRAARAAGVLSNAVPPELGEIIAKTPNLAAARPEDITICDLTGTGAQDTAIATYALKAAKAASIGKTINA